MAIFSEVNIVRTRPVTRKLIDSDKPPAIHPALTKLQIEAIRLPRQAITDLLGPSGPLAIAGRSKGSWRNDPDLARMVNDRLSSD